MLLLADHQGGSIGLGHEKTYKEAYVYCSDQPSQFFSGTNFLPV